ncbi:MAG: hypothetical protein NTY81_02890 [Candidatus Staskawiczbacteria bacterium]|nr:hypothetical protein [Candidatus Staskawiczbacteria bacterium]
MEKNKIQMWVLILVAIVIIAIVLFFIFSNKQTANQITTNNSSTTQPESVQDISAQDVGAGAAPISYANALVKYADRKIQLDTVCQAHPNTVTYKDNTGIMIDNRSPQTRTVKVGTTFTIKPWGFKIVVLPDVYLKSKTLLVDCNGSQNVATILVQE